MNPVTGRQKTFMTSASKVLDAIADGVSWIGAGAMVLMVLVIVSNVIGRYLFSKPLLGAVEMVGLLTVVLVFSALAFTESHRAHIAVNIVLSRLAGRTQRILAGMMCLLGATFFILMGWQAWDLMLSNLTPIVRTTGVLSVPFAPFMFIMAFGCLLLGLELFIHTFCPLESGRKDS